MANSPTQRSLQYCRKQGWVAGVTERWNSYVKIRQDLFGFIDIIMLDGGILAIQATTISNMAARRKKILAEHRARSWLDAGGGIEVWGWAKRGKVGKRKLWTLKRMPVVLEDLEAECAAAQLGATQ